MNVFDYLVIDAGFAGCALAERLTAGVGKPVPIVDKRPHRKPLPKPGSIASSGSALFGGTFSICYSKWGIVFAARDKSPRAWKRAKYPNEHNRIA